MGNQHSASHAANKPRKNVHWKSAGPPSAPGKPEIVPVPSEQEPDAVTLRWTASAQDGGAPLLGYQVECARLGTGAGAGASGWLRTAPPRVLRPELVLTGLEPPHRYQFRVAAVNLVGISEYSELSDVLNVGADSRIHDPPFFLQHLEDITALENEKTEFRVMFAGSPPPTIAWFKDGYEIFSSRRTAITTSDTTSVLVFHQTLASDEGEVKCTATNRAGHAITKARLELEAAPKLRYPRQYEDGLLYEINETIFLKISIVGKPTPTVEWLHDGRPIEQDDRVEVTSAGKVSMLKIATARRSDRGEYQVIARNSIGEDSGGFLVTVTAPPDPPRRLLLTRQLDKSLALEWDPPEDDGGCRIGNYVVEYFRTGWNVWLKATTSRKTSVTLFDLIEGSEYRFRVKAESPYGMSAPSIESAPVRIPGRTVDLEFLAVESRIIAEALVREDGQGAPVSPVPRRRRTHAATAAAPAPAIAPTPSVTPAPPRHDNKADNDEFMLVLYPNAQESSDDKAEKRKSFQLDLEDALSPPPLSLSAPELSSRCTLPFKALRNACSSTELLHERAMARFYKAVAMKEEYDANRVKETPKKPPRNIDIPNSNNEQNTVVVNSVTSYKAPEIIIKSDSVEDREYVYDSGSRQASRDSEPSENKWSVSFDEDYTASTVSTDEEYSEDGSLNGDERHLFSHEETYNPRNKVMRPSPVKETVEEEELEREPVKPLPLPDPNFIPKPILKRRESDIVEPPKPVEEEKPKPELKKEEKMTIFKKITKMPKQKIPFPKILNKKEPAKLPEKGKEEKPIVNSKLNTVEDKIEDEGRTVIDYYSNIVKEYGGQKKPAATLYLNTEDLKNVAEKQQKEKKNKVITKVKKPAVTAATKTPKTNNINNKPPQPAKTKLVNSKLKKTKPVEKQTSVDKNTPEKKVLDTMKPQEKPEKAPEKYTQHIVLKTAERATIVIPIDYQELEDRAKENVRTAIDYMVDVCLLLLAFWVYLFKDERLAIPFLILIIYRQFESLLVTVPAWISGHTPEWLKKKTS